MNQPANPEMDAFKTVYDALEPLEKEARQRVFTSVATMLAIGADAVKSNTPPPSGELSRGAENVHDDNDGTGKYTAFAELYAEADPTSNADKALIAGYWLQVCKGTENFSGFSINNELKNLGYKLANVTDALSKFIETKPQLVLQLKKTGKSRHAPEDLQAQQGRHRPSRGNDWWRTLDSRTRCLAWWELILRRLLPAISSQSGTTIQQRPLNARRPGSSLKHSFSAYSRFLKEASTQSQTLTVT